MMGEFHLTYVVWPILASVVLSVVLLYQCVHCALGNRAKESESSDLTTDLVRNGSVNRPREPLPVEIPDDDCDLYDKIGADTQRAELNKSGDQSKATKQISIPPTAIKIYEDIDPTYEAIAVDKSASIKKASNISMMSDIEKQQSTDKIDKSQRTLHALKNDDPYAVIKEENPLKAARKSYFQAMACKVSMDGVSDKAIKRPLRVDSEPGTSSVPGKESVSSFGSTVQPCDAVYAVVNKSRKNTDRENSSVNVSTTMLPNGNAVDENANLYAEVKKPKKKKDGSVVKSSLNDLVNRSTGGSESDAGIDKSASSRNAGPGSVASPKAVSKDSQEAGYETIPFDQTLGNTANPVRSTGSVKSPIGVTMNPMPVMSQTHGILKRSRSGSSSSPPWTDETNFMPLPYPLTDEYPILFVTPV